MAAAADAMKLFIEVEISPDEIPLATELFRTLRLVNLASFTRSQFYYRSLCSAPLLTERTFVREIRWFSAAI